MTAQFENIYQLEENRTTRKYEVNIITKGKDKIYIYNSIESHIILRQEYILQQEDIPDDVISENHHVFLTFSKERLKHNISTVNIPNLKDNISTKQGNVIYDSHINDTNNVDNDKMITQCIFSRRRPNH